MELFTRDEKKVEYLELIYDLVFVYMAGRNNALLVPVEGGFVPPMNFLGYVLCTLTIIQLWNFTTFYINLFGRNGLRDHVFLCVNMYLMYFIGEATGHDWIAYKEQYHIAWALILANIGLQYLIELWNHEADVWNRDLIKRMAAVLFVEAAIAFAAAWQGPVLTAVLSAAAIALGIILTAIGKSRSPGSMIDFAHLTERAMLYVVFTFGEMIVVLAAYFRGDGSFDPNVIYFSLMGFLIVVGLFLSYEIFYDHLLDRERQDNGFMYMAIHIFIIFALNNITASLEFMREDSVALVPKMTFLIVSVTAYYVFLFLMRGWAKAACGMDGAFYARLTALTAVFAVLMMVFRNHGFAHIFITAAYIFAVFGALYEVKHRTDKAQAEEDFMHGGACK